MRLWPIPAFVRQHYRRLAWRMTALLVASNVMMITSVGVGLIFLSFQAQRSAIVRTQNEIAQRAALEVSTYLSTIEQSLLIMAQTQNLADMDAAGQQQVLTQLLKTLPTFDEIIYVDALGNERAKVSPYYTFTRDELTTQTDNPGFRHAMSGERYLSGVSFSQYSGQPIVWLAIPVVDVRQETVGVLIAQVNFRQMWDIVINLQVGQSGYAYVVDEQGRLIAYRDISPVLRHEDFSDLPTVSAFLQGHPATIEYRGLVGQSVVGSQVPIAHTSWAMVVEQPRAEAYAPLYRMMGLLSVLLLAALVMAVIVGSRLATSIVQPIEKLQASAAAIGQGSLDQTIELKTGDEIELLAEAFNTMSRSLMQSRAEIEQWNRQLEILVDERTAAMQAANLQLKALVRVSQTINAPLALSAALEAVAEASRSVLGSDRSAVYLLDHDSKELHCALAQGLSSAYVQTILNSYRHIPAQDVLISHRPLVIHDAAHDPRLAPIQEAVQDEGYHSAVLLPLVYASESLGLLVLYHERVRDYSADDLELAQTFANQAAIAIKNADLFDAISQRVSQLATLYAVTSTVSQSLNLDQIINDALDKVLETMRADVGWVYLLDDEMDGLALRGYRGIETTTGGEPRWLRFGQGLSGHVAETRQPLLVSDAETALMPSLGVALPSDWRSCVVVPLGAKGQIVGVLGVATFVAAARPEGKRFTQRDADLLSSIGQQMGIAVENARLYEQSREVAVLAERNRLAREMHDTLVQDLTGIVIQLEAAERMVTRQPAGVAASLAQAKTLARRSLDEGRRSLWNLRPSPLEHLSLVEALQQIVAVLREQDGLNASFTRTGEERPIPPHMAFHIYRIGQEALTNVRKHAKAKQVRVTLAFAMDVLCLTVSDDGCGGANNAMKHASKDEYGLIGMRERAALLGGEFRVNSPLGAGTCIKVVVPLLAVSRNL